MLHRSPPNVLAHFNPSHLLKVLGYLTPIACQNLLCFDNNMSGSRPQPLPRFGDPDYSRAHRLQNQPADSSIITTPNILSVRADQIAQWLDSDRVWLLDMAKLYSQGRITTPVEVTQYRDGIHRRTNKFLELVSSKRTERQDIKQSLSDCIRALRTAVDASGGLISKAESDRFMEDLESYRYLD